jgi:hypothetical protein
LGIERGLLGNCIGSRIQTWNRYAYVTNNPTTYNDPSGLVMGLCNSPENRQCSTNDPSSANTTGFWDELRLFDGEGTRIIYDDYEGGTIDGSDDLFLVYEQGGNGSAGPGRNCVPLTRGCFNLPKQTFSQCMAANSSTFSLAGIAQGALNGLLGTSYNFKDNGLVQFVGGNSISSLLFGSASDAALTAGSNTPGLLNMAMGTVTTYGRNTSTITSLNIARSGGLPQALSSPSGGLQSVLGTADSILSLGLDFTTRIEIDATLVGVEASYCAYITR